MPPAESGATKFLEALKQTEQVVLSAHMQLLVNDVWVRLAYYGVLSPVHDTLVEIEELFHMRDKDAPGGIP